ncbi:MAG TPA: adenylate/guanylate cyclase domain-containing protein [Dongiaceae bacterium]|nr:adenylate/guanylate cyclase domain-containing protein [Dongiaceae bacterium]
MKRPDLTISIRVALLVGIVGCVLATAALVYIPWYITSQRGVTDLRTRLNAQIISDVRDKVGAVLTNAAGTQQAAASIIARGGIDIENENERRVFFLSLLKAQPTLSTIEFAWPDDRSFAVRRVNSSTLETALTEPEQGIPRQKMERYASTGADLTPTSAVTAASQYAPTQQFWYSQAFAEDGPSWSNIYPMYGSNHLGFTTVSTVRTPNGARGVLAVSLELADVSAFLKNVFVSPHGTVILTNIYGELVAAQEDNAAHPVGITRKLGESPAPLVQIAARAIAANNLSLKDLMNTRQLSYYVAERHQNYYVTAAPLSQMDLIVALVVPESDLLGEIDRNARFLAYALVGFIAVLAVIVVLMGRWTLGRPLVQVTENARQLGDFRFEGIRPIPSFLSEIRTLSAAISQMGASLSSFKKYVPTEVVRQLFAEGIEAELGGEKRELSIFFMDLVGFTALSESLGDELIPFLSLYLSEISDEVRHGQGTIDKYIGDAVMAFWGAPRSNPEHALYACRTALACQARLARLRSQRAHAHDISLRARIGINTGRVLVGNIGAEDRLNYTVIGDPVNVAARLEPLNKLYGTQILIGEDTYKAASAHIIARPLDRVAVYGKELGIEVYELLALKSEAAAGQYDWVDRFVEGIAAYRARRWDEAIAHFTQVILERGMDKPSSVMIERAQAFKKSPPPPAWSGLLMVAEK